MNTDCAQRFKANIAGNFTETTGRADFVGMTE